MELTGQPSPLTTWLGLGKDPDLANLVLSRARLEIVQKSCQNYPVLWFFILKMLRGHLKQWSLAPLSCYHHLFHVFKSESAHIHVLKC